MKLYPYQIPVVDELIEKLERNKKAVLVSPVGSGKTVMGLTAVFSFVSSRTDIIKEIIIITTAFKRDTADFDYHIDLISKDYPEIREGGVKIQVDSWNNLHKYKHYENCFFVFDEQKVSSGGSWSKIFEYIGKRNPFLLMTATPGDSYIEMRSIFIALGEYKNRTHFNAVHVVFNPYVRYPSVKEYKNVAWLKTLIDRYFVMVLDDELSNRNDLEVIVYQESKELEDTIYKTIKTERKTNGDIIGSRFELEHYVKALLFSSKKRISVLLDVILRHKNESILIFYNYKEELEVLYSGLLPLKRPIIITNGNIKDEIIKDKMSFHLVQMNISEGWESPANVCVLYSLPRSYKTLIQAMGRIDRRNKPVDKFHTYLLMSNSKIETHMYKRLLKKELFNIDNFKREFDGFLKDF